ncbi:fam-b protein [Plasmodium chabaudi chabaudi]|uniref:Fam-b protein n=1 Tax=Plasmodium chabaudi chabaudi TaxID=31271 RepID=A0A077XCF9_PLACU|nr:fam-b protein [Plasmodium chabaudi chabaudi]SCL89515.1 fam-b protein [Plasmodium chabaudi chabaudi]VTZ68986.1 fam-b protein [Plasmodium chabaudi chabaudi]|eukprot:XP_016655458.1 fam-b protein [Plasmodium chabaudi chabaudi]
MFFSSIIIFSCIGKTIKLKKRLKLIIYINKYFVSLHESNGVYKRSIYLERNVINFRNNMILADADSQFDLYDFYQSTSSLANQFNDYNDDDDKITNLRNIIDSHIKKHKESNILPNLNHVDKKTKILIRKLRKELEETQKGLII